MSDLCDDVFVNEAKEYVNFMKNSMLEQTRENNHQRNRLYPGGVENKRCHYESEKNNK